jgi:flagellin-like protein
MKGISPMIATVLLIAFTVGVGGIVSVWFSSLTSSQTGTVSSTAEKSAKCDGSSLLVEEVRYKSGHNLVNVTFRYNTGSEPLRNITITVTGGGLTNSSSTLYTTSDFVLGQTDSVQINVSSGATIPPEIVTVRGVCQTDRPVSGDCSSGQTCMKPS